MKRFFLYSLFVLVSLVILPVLFLTVRREIANAQIEREGQFLPASLPPLETTSRLEIIPFPMKQTMIGDKHENDNFRSL